MSSSTLRRFMLVLILACVTVGCMAAPPARLQGLFFSEQVRFGAFGDAFRHIIEFRENNEWVELVLTDNGIRPTFLPGTHPTSRGTYTYEVISGTQARLTLGNAPTGSFGSGGGVRLLVFTGDLAGNIEVPIAGGGKFEFFGAPAFHPLTNNSTRVAVDTARPLRNGFVLNQAAYVLLRAVGPGLAQFGVSPAAKEPRLTVTSTNAYQATNSDWNGANGELARVAQLVGAFPLAVGSKDAALLLRLPAGAYVATATVDAGDAGDILQEVYLFHAETTY